ncbi:hypothetical protein KAU45_07025 [bacterium]|nr:hypothetical protein [bacterium]
MRKFLFLAVLTAFLISLVGCGKELNDENFVDFWIEYMAAEDDEAEEKVMDSYGWTEDELDAYIEGLAEDEERVEKIYEALMEKDEEAAFAFTFLVVPEDAFDEMFLEELDAIPYLEGGAFEVPMTDGLMAQLFISIYPEEPNSPAAQPIYEGYMVTQEQVEEYFDDMLQDPDHCAAVSALVHGLDPDKGAAFDEITAGEPVANEEAPE